MSETHMLPQTFQYLNLFQKYFVHSANKMYVTKMPTILYIRVPRNATVIKGINVGIFWKKK